MLPKFIWVYVQHRKTNVTMAEPSLSSTYLRIFVRCSGFLSRAVALHPPRCHGPRYIFLLFFRAPRVIFHENTPLRVHLQLQSSDKSYESTTDAKLLERCP